MAIRRIVLLVLLAVSSAAAHCQTVPPEAHPQNGGAGLRSGAITPTGATVPDPRAIPNAQKSSIDRDAGRNDVGRTDYGICKGC